MELYCISISHQTTSLDIREKLSCAQPDISTALSGYVAHNEQFLGPGSEIVLLSTCNRLEVYLSFPGENHPLAGKTEEVKEILLGLISQTTAYTGPDLASHCVLYQNLAVVEHLFRVTAGLESQVIGEVQIIGQVSEALDLALAAGSARHTLASLFRGALHAAKRAQTETSIGKNPASLSSVAASIAEQVIGKMNMQPVVVIGAGEMSYLAVRAFHARGAQHITVINRTYANAVRLAKQYGCMALPWEELHYALQTADVVVSATAAQESILTSADLQSVMDQRQNRPLLVLDIALPRDIDPASRELPGVTVYDLDEMKLLLRQSLDSRQKEARQVDAILHEELLAFSHWMEVIPTVGKLHRKAEMIRQHEVERTLHHLPDLDPQVQEQIELLTRSLVKKLFHEPTTRIRKDVKNGELKTYTNTLQFLFGLDEEDPDHNQARPAQSRESGNYD